MEPGWGGEGGGEGVLSQVPALTSLLPAPLKRPWSQQCALASMSSALSSLTWPWHTISSFNWGKRNPLPAPSLHVNHTLLLWQAHDQKQVKKRESFVSSSNCRLTSHHWEKTGKDLKAGTWNPELKQRSQRSSTYWIDRSIPRSWSVCFLIPPRTACLGTSLPTVGWILL